MGKKKKEADLVAELERSYERWEYLREHGGSDPFYADGTNMNLVRNHIMYYKGKMVEEYGADHDKYPLIFYKELPPVVKEDYIARAGEIRNQAVAALDCYLADPSLIKKRQRKSVFTMCLAMCPVLPVQSRTAI